jgi:hypothetical protein
MPAPGESTPRSRRCDSRAQTGARGEDARHATMSQSAHQRRSFRGEAMPATWSFRLVPAALPQSACSIVVTRVGLLGSQASKGTWVCKSEIFINFYFTLLTGSVGRAEPHTFGSIETVLAALAAGTGWYSGQSTPGARRRGGRGRSQEPLPSPERCACHAPALAAGANAGHPRAAGRARSPARPAQWAGRPWPVRLRSRIDAGWRSAPLAPSADGPCPHSGRPGWSPCASANPNAPSSNHSCGLPGSQANSGRQV